MAVAHSYSEERLGETDADLVLRHLGDIDEARLSTLYATLYS